MQQKAVFISYRRSTSKYLARIIQNTLEGNGWDVFLDVDRIHSGNFGQIILSQIATCPHFILLITTDSLKRCQNEDDWVLREIKEAIRLKRNIIPIVEEKEVNFHTETAWLPEDIRKIIRNQNYLPLYNYYFPEAMRKLQEQFLSISKIVSTPHRLSSIKQMPPPFDWISIPEAKYKISKYPVTNAQYAKFVGANCYHDSRWWSDAGWIARNKGWHYRNDWKPSGTPWTEPLYWQNKQWNGSEYPIVGISWYEAEAFCNWLSSITGESISLPDNQQWQYAARGKDAFKYPWGNKWDCRKCNNSVSPCNSHHTSPVMHYEDSGSSPFGVIDMAGNIWEWCLTDSTHHSDSKVVCGGSWYAANEKLFQSSYVGWYYAYARSNDYGFRLICLD